RELLDKLNQRSFRKCPGCRASLFQEVDRPALGSLPRERFELQQWATARVNIDYHIEFDRHYYSVPYILTGLVVGDPLDPCHGRDLPPRRARGFARPQLPGLSRHDD